MSPSETAFRPPTTPPHDPAANAADAAEELLKPSTPASEYWSIAFRIVALAVAVGIALWLTVALRQIILQALLAIILACGLAPLVERLHRMGLPRAAAVLLIYLALILSLVVFGVVIIPPIYHEIELAIVNAPSYGDQISDRLREMQAQFPFLPPLDEQLLQQLRGLGSQVGQLASQALVVARFALGVVSGLLNTILVLLITLYLVVDGHRVREYFLSYFPPSQRPRLRHITGRMGARMGGWLVGQITLCVVIGSISYVGLSLLGIRGAVLLAVIAAIGEAIPIVGPIASAVPAIIVAATQSPLLAVAVLILYLVIQQLENNLLVPKIMERAVSLHPLAVVLSLLTGGELLGVIGTIVAVPVAAAVAVILDEIRRVERSPEPAPINAPEAAA